MAKADKKELNKIDAMLGEALDVLNEMSDRARTRYAGLSERAQQGPNGQKALIYADALEAARDQLETAQISVQAILAEGDGT
jgi:BMFP domain-containing protein YqiC